MVNTYLQVNERTVRNNAGGETFTVNELDRLERFLILGTVGGTYYVAERDLTKQNLDAVSQVIRSQGKAAVDKIVEVGLSNRAPKHDPALVAYAMAVSAEDANVRAYALSFFNKIVRTGTHLFHFLAYVDGRRGWGRSLRRAVANWYLEKSDDQLAYQLVKYKQRDGWSHRDALRLAHPQAQSASQNELLRYAVSGTLHAMDTQAHRFVEACEQASRAESVDEVVRLIREYNVPRETINTQFMKAPQVWEALAPNMGLTALLRNLRNMTNDGYLVQGSNAVRVVRDRLTDAEGLRKARIHPAHVFLAKKQATMVPAPIQTALEEAFFASFGNVTPTNKRIMLALDVSGSMDGGFGYNYVNGRVVEPVATPREWSALQAMVTARVEPYAEFRAFSHEFKNVNITARDSLDEVIRKLRNIPMGGTDCSLPMFAARNAGEKFDAFCVYTDNETWASGWGYGYRGPRSSGDPMRELREYRKASGIHDAKLVVVGITATDFTIADPNDLNTLDVVGFDANAPAVMADFIAR